MDHQRELLAQVLLDSFGGRFHLSRSRALRHAESVLRAGFTLPQVVTSAAELAQLSVGAVVIRSQHAGRPDAFVRRADGWVDVDGGEPVADAHLFTPGTWLTLGRP
ncbi:hypothetical protein [Aeromicrobium sp. Leaf350]|uniref:hypothetical protein n=1 Tax=Aeromicrobium sp. Leaf350 TaxID=2876565 RepID=UPI001E3FE6D7|nr:hypothetical protein [Aeromicrobium sp. Leaf350]